MAKFTFRLDSVLKLRKEQKKHFELELAGVQNEKIKAQNTLKTVINTKISTWEGINSSKNRQVLEFQTDYYYINALDKDINKNIGKIDRISKVENSVINDIVKLSKAQKTIERLREKHKEEYDKENKRIEQNYLDDISQKLKNRF